MVEIRYVDSLEGMTPAQLAGFFVGWPHSPSPETHIRLLAGSSAVVLAIDEATGQVVGFVTALSDGVQSAFIPLLEVLPDYQGRGIGTALLTRILERIGPIPNVDLMCDPELVPFYARFGMMPATGMVLRKWMGPASGGP